MTPTELCRAYESGDIVGWLGNDNPELVREQFRLIAHHFQPFRITGQVEPSAGKKVMLYQAVRAVLGKDTDNYPQQVGDCFVAGTLILMGDGSQKPIEDVKTGDLVVSHTGTVRAVTNTIVKPYSGTLLTLTAKGHPSPITATPDHRFIRVPFKNHRYGHGDFKWDAIGTLDAGSKVLIPRGLDNEANFETLKVFDEPTSNVPPVQFVKVDARLGRLLGLYLAEGGVSTNDHGPHRLDFSLSHLEDGLADDICRLFQEVFGVTARVNRLPSKPTVQMVRCGNTDVARFVKGLIPGNVYSKRIPDFVFRASREVRESVLMGWMDGDGSDKCPGKMVGVSASQGLLQDVHRLCRSLGLRPMYNLRQKAAHQRVAAGQVCLYGQPSEGRAAKKMRDLGEFGRAVSVKTISAQEVVGATVYCLEVEHDHSFIANGYAVHNCVAFGAKNATEYLTCLDMLMRGKRFKWRPVFPPYYYGTGRVYIGNSRIFGDGSLGGWMAAAVQKYGTLFSDEKDVPKYAGSISRAWGDSNPRNDLDNWKQTASPYLVKSAALIKSWGDLVEAICNGYPCTTASNVGYSMEPSSDGFHRQTTSWPHQMVLIGLDDNDKDPYAIILNSWGPGAHGKLKDFDDGHDLPGGVLRVRRKDVEKHIRAEETFAFSNFNGFPAQDIDKALFKIF